MSLVILLLWVDAALAYVGPGSGVEFVPYFMSLAVWIVTAFSAVLLWPLYALIRWIRGVKKTATLPREATDPASPRPSESSHANP